MILANSKEPPLSDASVARTLEPYGVRATPQLCNQIRRYIGILTKWNQRVNLTRIVEPAQILARHFGESFFAASAVPISSGRLADVGSGAGFPGLALKLLVPDLEVVLIESNTRKAAFLREVIRELGIERAVVWRERAGDRDPGLPFDFVTSRAAGGWTGILSWARTAVGLGGRIVLWLGTADSERVRAMPGWEWRKPVPMPGAYRTELVVGLHAEAMV